MFCFWFSIITKIYGTLSGVEMVIRTIIRPYLSRLRAPLERVESTSRATLMDPVARAVQSGDAVSACWVASL